MSASQSQYTAARIFLQSYSDAIKTLEQSASKQLERQSYERFREQATNELKATNYIETLQGWNQHSRDCSKPGLLRQVKAFQFSQYFFLKFMPEFPGFQGDAAQLHSYFQAVKGKLQK